MEDKKVKSEWKFDEKTKIISGTEELDKFKFQVVRQKDKQSKQENLLIYAYYNGDDEDCGKVILNISKINNEITKLQDIGIVLGRQYYIELIKTIKENFYQLPLDKVDNIWNYISEEEILKFVRHFKGYIIEKKIEKKDKCYNIDVNEFTEEFNEHMFSYDEKEYRKALRFYGYTKCSGTSFTHVVKLDDKKSKRCISFFADKIDAIEEV